MTLTDPLGIRKSDEDRLTTVLIYIIDIFVYGIVRTWSLLLWGCIYISVTRIGRSILS